MPDLANRRDALRTHVDAEQQRYASLSTELQRSHDVIIALSAQIALLDELIAAQDASDAAESRPVCDNDSRNS